MNKYQLKLYMVSFKELQVQNKVENHKLFKQIDFLRLFYKDQNQL